MRAAFYECDITPPLYCDMPGYYRHNPAEDVYDRLYAKALVVEDAGKYAAIVALDTCESDDVLTETVLNRVCEHTDIPRGAICVHTVHTHKGAPTESLPHVNQIADEAYRNVCFRLTADAIILAYKRLDDAAASFGISEAKGLAFNRNYVLKDGSICSFSAPREKLSHMLDGTDDEVSVLLFERCGKKIGAVISFACHQDCAQGVNGYSADYSSVLSKELKAKYGQEFVSLFMIGTAGDINHIPNDPDVKLPKGWYRELGKTLAEKADLAIQSAKPVGDGVDVLKENITVKCRTLSNEEYEAQIAKWEKIGATMRINNLKHYHKTNKIAEESMPMQVIRIGDTCIYAYPGEIYVAFGKEIKARSPFKNNIVTENNNAFCGYIPTEKAFAPESDLYEISLCYDSRHTKETGRLMTEKLIEMAEDLNCRQA